MLIGVLHSELLISTQRDMQATRFPVRLIERGKYRAKHPKFRGQKFEEMAFEVQDDISGITIEMK